MPTTISKTNIWNLALARVGAAPILDAATEDQNNASWVACNQAWQLAVADPGRNHAWNCLLNPAVLVATDQTPIVPPTPDVTVTAWAPATAYVADQYVSYGLAIYQAFFAHTSSANFTNDLTAGKWFETDIGNTNPFGTNLGSNYPSGWAYQYPLPADCLLVTEYNDVAPGPEQEWEIIGINLYSNDTSAVIKYVQFTEDTTRYDAMFVECVVLKLAAMLATTLRQDDTSIADRMERQFSVKLRAARTRDAGERKPRRFSPVNNSRFIRSRWFSTNS